MDTVNYLADLGVSENVLALVVDLDLELGRVPLWFRNVVADNHIYKKVKMCTHPITVSRTRKDGSTLTETFPCGKCAECRAKDQSSFAALSCLEAESAGSIGFLTLTYDNAHLPVLVTRHNRGEVIMSEFFEIDYCLTDPVVPVPYPGVLTDGSEVFACASLRREDVKLFVKAYRQDYFRRNGKRLDLRLTYFGEYGEKNIVRIIICLSMALTALSLYVCHLFGSLALSM